MRAKSPLVPTKPLARRRGVLGRRSRFTTALQPPNPRRGACARKVPTWRLNCRCPSARRGGVGVEVRGASSQRWLCRVPPVGVGVVRCVSPTAALAFPLGGVGVGRSVFPTSSLGRSTPAPDWFVPCSSPKLPLRVPSGAGRSSRRVRLAVDVCFALPTDSPRMTGATRSAKPPKTERGVFRSSELGERTAALGLPPCGGRRPLSIGLPRVAVRGGRLPALAEDRFELWLGQPRARSTACPAWSAPRAACAFRLRLFSPDGENRSPRWGRLRDTTTDDNGTRGGAVGCCSAWRFAKAGSAAKRGAGGDLALRLQRG